MQLFSRHFYFKQYYFPSSYKWGKIESTMVHSFWVENRWVSAKDLKEGDLLTLADGSAARISGVYGEKLDEAVVVYNFEVEEFHTYYVTEAGVLVHNANKVGGCGVTGNKSDSGTREYQSSGKMSDNLLLNPRTNTNGTNNLTEWRRQVLKSDIKVERVKFVGEDAVKVDKGVWRSLDGTRQFRVVESDYFGRHPIGEPKVYNAPHVHFEFLGMPNKGGNKLKVIKNIHVPLVD